MGAVEVTPGAAVAVAPMAAVVAASMGAEVEDSMEEAGGFMAVRKGVDRPAAASKVTAAGSTAAGDPSVEGATKATQEPDVMWPHRKITPRIFLGQSAMDNGIHLEMPEPRSVQAKAALREALQTQKEA
jgi:hypothetical protein